MEKEQKLIERRQSTPEQSSLWNKLTISQKFAATNLTHFGYELTYIRFIDAGGLAIFICGERVATINSDGDIDSAPDIKIR